MINTTDIYDTMLRSFNKYKSIYEIKSVVNKPFFTVRQKHNFSVIQFNSNTMKLRNIYSNIPLVTGTMDSSTKLILIDAQQHLQLFDLIIKKPLMEGKIFDNELTIDNWISVRFIEPNKFICASRRIVAIYDERQPITKPISSTTFAMGPCDDISCMEQSNSSHNTFFATTHKLLALDMRNYKDGDVPLTWFHRLKTSPLTMDISKIDDTSEMIAIGGVKSGDVKICDTKTIQNATISTHLPYTPLSVHDFFKYTKSKGKFLNPNSLIEHQLRQSITGIKLRKINSNKFSLLTKNSCGDVFAQEILCNEINDAMEVPESFITKMDIWDEELRINGERENKLNFQATDITNFAALAAFLGSNINKKLEKNQSEPPPDTPKPEWQMSLEELSSYKDILANSLLDKWVIADNVVEPDVNYTDDRMNNWVDSTVEQYKYEIFSEDICVKSEEEMQETYYNPTYEHMDSDD